jgi:translation initiation factor 5A
MADEFEHATLKDIRPGRFVLIEGIPCKVVDVETSSPGKHGSAKVRLTAMSIFGGVKKTYIGTGHADIQVPIILKMKAQVVSVGGANAQLMNNETYEVFELPVPEELTAVVKPGALVEVIEVMSQRMISRLLSS